MNNVQLYEMSKKKPTVKRGKYRVIVHNDNHNTFDHVIDSLMDVCGHVYLQSVQCALIVHEAKRCAVYTDTYEECYQVHTELRKLGITVTVEKC
jgi:ATP-dependent Clp protease adaptor protein ClpS